MGEALLKCIKWSDDKAVLENVPIPPIPAESALVKVLSSLIYSPFRNRSLVKNARVGVTLGSFGVVRVVEPGVRSNVAPGEVYGVIPYCRKGILGLDLDGLASEYAVIPAECLIRTEANHTQQLTPLYIEFGYIDEVVKLLRRSSKTLIVGCGLTAYVLGLLARNYRNTEVLCLNVNQVKQLQDLGLPLRKNVEDVGKGVDLLLLTDDADVDLMELLDNGGRIYLTPGVFAKDLRFKCVLSRVELMRPNLFKPECGKTYVDRVSKYILNTWVGFTNDLSQALSAFEFFERIVLTT